MTNALLDQTKELKQSSLLLYCRASFSEGEQPPACLFFFFQCYFLQTTLHLLFTASSFLLSALAASKRHTTHSPTTLNCNHFGAAGCVSCTLRTRHFFPTALSTRHTLAPTSHPSSVRPGLYHAQTSLRHAGHPCAVHSSLARCVVSLNSQTHHKGTWSRKGATALYSC